MLKKKYFYLGERSGQYEFAACNSLYGFFAVLITLRH